MPAITHNKRIRKYSKVILTAFDFTALKTLQHFISVVIHNEVHIFYVAILKLFMLVGRESRCELQKEWSDHYKGTTNI